MYKATSNQVSARLNTDELAVFNSFIERYQTDNGITFDSFREAINHIASNYSEPKPAIEPVMEPLPPKRDSSVRISDEIIEEVRIYGEKNGMSIDGDFFPSEVIQHALNHQCAAPTESPIKEIDPFSVVVPFLENEHEWVMRINDNRNKKLSAENQETPGETVRKAFFNESVIYNYSGEFYTGCE